MAIRYHEFADIKEAKEDKIYQALPQERKNIAEFYIKLLQDMDKTGNLLERSVSGARKTVEYFDSEYAKDYTLTDEYLKIALSGEGCGLMRRLEWTNLAISGYPYTQ